MFILLTFHSPKLTVRTLSYLPHQFSGALSPSQSWTNVSPVNNIQLKAVLVAYSILPSLKLIWLNMQQSVGVKTLI